MSYRHNFLVTQDSEAEDPFCGASPCSAPSLFFRKKIFSFGFEHVHDYFSMTLFG